ncbi:AAA family ATPase [uncultured Desulfobacter sp.]|uniref:AAA family ATPase n=1 Tax=uncultured Desulfobacter sp. TaxID=240139 RepID=UPI002AABB3F5|nr:AAA family ATPase [uncultured Desulfobacter sp.]
MIITCPRCARNHKVDPDALKPFADAGKKTIMATCKSCKFKFPVALSSLLSLEEETLETQRQTGSLARKICVTLSKGGVGKTTTSVNLSAGLALAGYKVLLVDTDTQGQSSYILGKRPGAGLTELLTRELSVSDCLIEARNNLWLISGGKSLAGVKRIIDKKSFGAEFTLSEALSPLDNQFDFIIIDTSPGWDQLIVNVLFYASEVLVPVALEVMPLHGLSEFIKSLAAIQKYRNEVQLKYIVPTFLDLRIKGPKVLYDQLRQLYPQQLCVPIRYNESLAEAPSFGKTIFEFAPGSTASEDYRSLVRRVSGNESALLK